jgi:soluble lytic murein transglycosylase-like protein
VTPSELKPLIIKYAAKHKLKPEIVYGVIKKESTFDEFAVRFEPHYKWLVTPSKVKPITCSLATEENLQKTSFGLMQCMGGLLRELGYWGWLSAILADPEMQIDYGCKYLAKQIGKYGELRGISAYNAGSPTGSNAEYVSKVMEYSREWASIPDQAASAIPPLVETADEIEHIEAHKKIEAFFQAVKAAI